MGDVIIKRGVVDSVKDALDGGRIKVRLEEDNTCPRNDLPYAFPLIPKVFQSIPKVGEGVLVFNVQAGNYGSQRFYLGPIISEMQDITKADFGQDDSTATAALQSAVVEMDKPLQDFPSVDGAFPDKEDVAIIGRKGNDIILKEDEIDLRCGIRQDAVGEEDKSLRGNVMFNSENPAYIQVKHEKNLLGDSGDGVINLVADKINIVSHVKDDGNDLNVRLVHPNSKNGDKTDPLLHSEDIEDLISQLHQVPYGDVLVKILRQMLLAILNHTHAANGLPPVKGVENFVKQASEINFDELLSNHVRIS